MLFQSVTYIVFLCLNFSRQEVAVNAAILNKSSDTDAVLFVLVAKQRNLSICCQDYRLAEAKLEQRMVLLEQILMLLEQMLMLLEQRLFF